MVAIESYVKKSNMATPRKDKISIFDIIQFLFNAHTKLRYQNDRNKIIFHLICILRKSVKICCSYGQNSVQKRRFFLRFYFPADTIFAVKFKQHTLAQQNAVQKLSKCVSYHLNPSFKR